MEYASIEEIKNALNLENNDNDELITRLVKAVSKIFDKYIWYNLGVRTYWQYLRNNTWENILFPSYSPIKWVNEIKDSSWDLKIKKIVDDIIYLQEWVFWDVFIEYEAGYEQSNEIEDIKEMCIKTVTNLYNVYIQNWEIKSKSIDGISISYLEGKLKDSDIMSIRNILDSYKIKNYNIV